MGEIRTGGDMADDTELVVTDFQFEAHGYDPEDMVIRCTRCPWFSERFFEKRTLMELIGIANDHAELAHG